MTTTSTNTTPARVEPHVVRDRLSRDVTRILSESLHQFEELEQEIEEKYFDVDGILTGRPSREQRASAIRSMPYEKPRNQTKVRVSKDAHFLTVPGRGNFIPTSHFAHLMPA
jgi:hypothetical protein